MDEFVDAANAYARHLQLFSTFGSIFFLAVSCIGVISGRMLRPGWNYVGLVIFGILTVFMICLALSRRIRHMVLMPWMLPVLPSWFAACKAFKGRREAFRVTYGIGHDSLVQGPRWCTPCRVSVSEGGIHMVRWVSGKVYEDGCPWKLVECVRVTPHAIVLGPSAWSKAHFNSLDGLIRVGDVSHCVVVPRKSVGNVDKFVTDCWMHVLAVRPDLRKPLSRKTRFRRWFHGDDL